ncbi:hypothetical protein HGRIS_009430 [Hohenbuehelia grisea]|uniref:Uncharacterized protein n=1 Tax=Hohenbuehelia grisea TaxID=104357 RepID=A0ABR3J1I6_9AGAR
MSSFDDRLNSYVLPPPGPLYYAVRRAVWLTPKQNTTAPRPPPSSSRKRLETALSAPGAVHDNTLWKSAIENVWKGFSGGATLRHRLPLSTVVQVLHAVWLRDDTWPPGASAPDPDDIAESSSIATPVLVLKTSISAEENPQSTTAIGFSA